MLFDPTTRKCDDSSNIDCDYRHCSGKKAGLIYIEMFNFILDPARCPCVNFDEPGQFYCDSKVNGTTLFPDVTDCASYLNCTSGCIESILVSCVKCNLILYNLFAVSIELFVSRSIRMVQQSP